VADVPHDALLGVAPGGGGGIGHVHPARDVHLAGGRVPIERRGGLLEMAAVERDLLGQGVGRGQGREHEPEAVARRVGERAVGGPGHEQWRVGLPLADREDLVLPLDDRPELEHADCTIRLVLVDPCENNYSAGPGATRSLSQSTRGGGSTHSGLQSAKESQDESRSTP
jgi:hypothetical protein